MSITMLNEQDILNVMVGATLMGSGGGGSFRDGVDLLNAFKKNHPEKEVKVGLVQPSDMDETSNAVVVAIMGAPSGSLEQPDLSGCVIGAFDEISIIAERYNRKIDYMLPIELGGFNTFVPMLISLLTGRPILDADASGRAVPGLETILSAVNGCDTAPVAMADMHDNRVNLIPADKKDAALVEEMALPVVDLFEQNAGIAGWMFTKDEVTSLIPNFTLSKAKEIGELISEMVAQKPADQDYVDEIFSALSDAGVLTTRALHSTPQHIEDYSSEQVGGWDVGEFYIGGKGSDPRLHIKFSNENLFVEQQNKDLSWTTVLTAPEIITLYNAKTGEPLTNQDLEIAYADNTLDDLEIMVGIIKVDDKWHLNPAVVSAVWAPYLERLGYTGDLVPFS